MNFLIAPHHGSGSEGSPLWLNYINFKNYFNFLGVIFSVPINGPFGHPNQYIGMQNFFNFVWSHLIVYNRVEKGAVSTNNKEENDIRLREKQTQNPVFLTSLVSLAHCIKITKEEMSIFNGSSFYNLISSNGWSVRLQKFLDYFDTDDPLVLACGIGAFFQNMKILKVCNSLGQTCFEWLLQNEKSRILKNLLKVAKIASGIDNDLKDLASLWNLCKMPKMTIETFIETCFFRKTLSPEKRFDQLKQLEQLTGFKISN